MGNAWDYLPNGELVELIEILPEDTDKYCLRSCKELWVDFTKDIVKPCTHSQGVDIYDDNKFSQYLQDIDNEVVRSECNYCHKVNPDFRLDGNVLWSTPGHGNCHVEFLIDKTFTKDILEKYVKKIASDTNKFACICISKDEPGKDIIEENHIELIAKPFYEVNILRNRGLRYDFKTDLNFSIERTRKIIAYMRRMQRRYPGMLVNIQPSKKSLQNDFDKKIELFVKGKLEIVARTEETKVRLEMLYNKNKKMHLTIQV